jgi:ElaA protein
MPHIQTYTLQHFDALSAAELYQICQLRQEVFVVEQNCPYLDCDGKDLAGYHLQGYDASGQLIAYTRLLPVGVAYDNFCSIGRVVVAQSARGQGDGRFLMRESIKHCQQLWPGSPVRIGAQSYLERFYTNLGFVSTGHYYIEDGIPHQTMDYHL